MIEAISGNISIVMTMHCNFEIPKTVAKANDELFQIYSQKLFSHLSFQDIWQNLWVTKQIHAQSLDKT